MAQTKKQKQQKVLANLEAHLKQLEAAYQKYLAEPCYPGDYVSPRGQLHISLQTEVARLRNKIDRGE